MNTTPIVKDSKAPTKKSKLKRISIKIAAILAVISGAAFYFTQIAPFETTDDAQIEGNIVKLAPQVGGQVLKLLVNDNQRVKEGDLLLEIDPCYYQAALDQAKANLENAKAQSEFAQADVKRYQAMGSLGVSQSQIDLAVQRSRSATAQVAQAQAALTKAQLDMEHTKVTAPVGGRITKRSVELGDYVQPGQALLAIVPRDYWVVANFKETQMTHMRPGQPVIVKIDAFPGTELAAHIDSIQSGAGARFSLFPPENTSGNFIKVVQRVPVKIVFDHLLDINFPIGPGMSVEPKVKVK